MRWAAKRDATEAGIVDALEAAGWAVVPVSDTGFPDLCCVRDGQVRLLEVKSKGGSLTEAQVVVHAKLAAAGLAVHVVRTPEAALAAVDVTPWEPPPSNPVLAEGLRMARRTPKKRGGGQ